MAEHREVQQAWSDFLSFFHKHKNVLQELSPNMPVPKGPGNVVHPGTSIPAGGMPEPMPIVPVPIDTDEPDAQGEVAISKIGTAWDGWRHNIAEVANGDLTADQKGHALANLSHANGVYNIGFMHFIGTCYESAANGDGLPYNLDTNAPIHNTMSWPDAVHEFDGASYNLGTTQGVYDWCLKLGKPPGPNV